MTDAELATLRPGDRVRCLVNGGRTGESVDCVVTTIDRRRVHLRARESGLQTVMDAEFVTPLPADSELDALPLRSLESRWRALTDEVLVAITHAVENGASLDDLIVRFAADEHRASAEIHRVTTTEGKTAKAERVATCAVGVDVVVEQSS
jgi:hypothetical protein